MQMTGRWLLGITCGMALVLGDVGVAVATPVGRDSTDHERQVAQLTAGIAAEVATLRHLPLRHPVQVEIISLDAFNDMLQDQLDEQLDGGQLRGFELAFQSLGWTERPLHLRQALIDMMLGQAAALYDPEADVYLLIEGELDSLQIDTISAHELTHALTDQHFDLNALVMQPARQGMSEDRLQALRFLVEGDATYIMMLREMSRHLGSQSSPVATAAGGAAPPPALANALRLGLQQVVNMSFEQLLAMHTGQIAAQGERFARAAAALDSMPPVLIKPLLDAYLHGALLVANLIERGGWAAVDSLYAHPPATTEQVLHMDRLFPTRDTPRAPYMHAPASLVPGWDLLLDESVGELYVRTLFAATALAPAADELAAGWDGDRLLVLSREDEWLVVWATVWDDPQEALAFRDGYRRLLDLRSTAVPLASAAADSLVGWQVAGRPTYLARRVDQVTIAQAGTQSLARRLLEQSLPPASVPGGSDQGQ